MYEWLRNDGARKPSIEVEERLMKKSHRLEGKFANCSSDLKNTENETQK